VTKELENPNNKGGTNNADIIIIIIIIIITIEISFCVLNTHCLPFIKYSSL
jgi:hypothetical protein